MANEETEKKEETKPAPAKTGNKGTKLGTRKELPSVAHLLTYGNPETAHLPKTWKETIGFPLALAVVFFLSLLTFHYAPHSSSKHPGFKLPQRNGPRVDPADVAKDSGTEPLTETHPDSEAPKIEL